VGDWSATTVIDSAVALGTLALAIATFALVRRTRQEAEATREAVEATRTSSLENVRARIDARAPLIIVLPDPPDWPPSFPPSSGVEGGHDQMASDQRFPSSQGQERQLLIATNGNLRNDGKSTAFVSFSHGGRLSEELPWVVEVSEQPGSPLYAIAPGALASFQLLGGRPLREWMGAYCARAADSGEHPEESQLRFEVTVTDQLDAGIIDRIQIIVRGYPIEPVPQDREHWQLASDPRNRPFASTAITERLYYASKQKNQILT
jgi:hypothetical protein